MDATAMDVEGQIMNNLNLVPEKLKTNCEAEQLYESKVIEKFIGKFGGFTKPDSLTKKERRNILRLNKLLDKKEERKLFKLKQHAAKMKEDVEKIGEQGNSSKKNTKTMREVKMSESNCKQRVAFDLSYFNLNVMKYLEMRMCIKQVLRCYAENRKAKNPLQMYITSMKGKAEELLSRNSGYKQWDVNFNEESFLDVFKMEEVVYLTSDSENVIETLDESKVYVIGGLLDHNSLKGLSYNKAISNKISHGKLPIDKYMNMKTLQVLTVNQVFSILLLVSSGTSWPEAFIKTIPRRKEATLKALEELKELSE